MTKDTWRNHYVLDDEGNVQVEPDLFTWAIWLQNNRERTFIAEDEVNGFRVSTIFLGLDFDIAETSRTPLVFETMVFRGSDIVLKSLYDSMALAKASHEIAVELARRDMIGSFNEGRC